jgi:hypothetical protein
MKRVTFIETIATVALACGSIFLIGRSLLVIYKNYFIPIYWDEWEIVRQLVSKSDTASNLFGLLIRQNEHIIATTRILFWADYAFFKLTNGPMVASIAILNSLDAWLLSSLLFWGERRSKLFWTVWLVFTASGLSLAQWENLLWGFQPQFSLVLLGALAAILIAIKMPAADDLKGFGWLAALVLAIGFCVFSMGNGIAIPISVLFLLILLRASLLKCLVTAVFSIAFVAAFFALTKGATPIGDQSLNTPYNMVRFFFVMIGSPLDGDVSSAAILGLILFITVCSLFILNVMVPSIKSRKVDRSLAGLFALAGFLFASAAAAAWGRTSLGVGAATALRYATPMLLLWMTNFSIVLRILWLSKAQPWVSRSAVSMCVITAAFATAAWSTFRPETNALMSFSMSKTQAAYFIASGALAPAELRELYPNPSLIMESISFLREHGLNIFAERGGVQKPSADEIRSLKFAKSMHACRGYVDETIRLDSDVWGANGWATDAGGRTPRFILATDQTGQLLGFTAPLIARPDVEQAIGARHFRGFKLPLRTVESSQGPYLVVAIANSGEAPCRLALPDPLP